MEEWEAHKKLEKTMEEDYQDKDLTNHETMREIFKVPKDKKVVDDMNDKVFDFLYQRMRER